MAEENEVIVPIDTPEDIQAASDLGWTTKDKFRGDAARWVDAKTFLERGQTVLPLIKKQKERLETEVTELRARDAARESELKAMRVALKAVEESQQDDLAERVVAAKEDLEDQIAKASEDGDHRRIAKLTVQLTELIAADKAKIATPPTDEDKTLTPPPLSAEHRAWAAENRSWLESDAKRANMAVALGQAIAREGEFRGAAFYAELDRRLDQYYEKGGKPVDKVGGGRSSADNNDARGSGGKSYADLPADAREACTSMERRMVGAGKPHKDKASWQKSYASQYFQEGAR